MAVKLKMSPVGIADIGKFLLMPTKRNKIVDKAPAAKVSGRFLINEKAKEMHPDFQHMIIDEIIEHKGADTKSFILKRADGKKAAFFRAGQYVSVLLPIGKSLVTRPYSISSSPAWSKEGKLAITVRNNPNGYAAKYINEKWKEGNEVVISGAEGSFFYEPLRDAKNVVALAGGSGITPFLSMAYAIRDGIEDFNLTIIFGSKTEDGILFKAELDKICAETDKVKVVHVLSDEKKDGFENGFITAELIKKYAPDDKYSIFICGSEGMYRFLTPEIDKLGLERKYIRRELLGVTKDVASLEGYPKKVKKTYTLTVKQGTEEYTIKGNTNEPILAAIERAGINAPSRCRSGECGFCRSKLISGDIFCPEDNEGRRWADSVNGYIHPCATFALSDIVIEVPGSYLK